MTDQSTRNLKEAFKGESQANRRYLAFAQQAEEEGFTGIARLFRAAAESETIHALNHLKAMDGVQATRDNVAEALKGEVDESDSMYPMFMDQAKRDANNKALNSFYWANEAEKIHADFYGKALVSVKQGNDLKLGKLYICEVCGHTVEGAPPDKCPTCGEGADKFQLVE